MDQFRNIKSFQNEKEQSQLQIGRRFQEACEMIEKNRHKILDSESSSSEDENTDLSIIEKTCSIYGEDENQNLQKVREHLQDIITSGAITCLICIETVKKNEKIWNCQNCYCVLHLHCIQKWAKDSLYHMSNNVSEEKNSLKWSCPKCRWKYDPCEKPVKYLCFCGKVENPSFDSWSIPHSCQQVCDKKLKPDCGHSCCLLCHPGPCPPCPKTVIVSCCCSKSLQVSRRCSDKEWTCGQKCGKKLDCKVHFCNKPCHKGFCPPCDRQSIQKCRCGRNSMLRPCFDATWLCNEVCKKLLQCGHHFCELTCHSGLCPTCPSSGLRSCPCEKKSVILPCTESIPTCGDTCGKLLDCGLHRCSQRCHYGSCETCIQMKIMKCRCGQREKSVPCCSKEFTCDIKCKKRRDCERHNCNKKCCTGNCPPCEITCGKTLNCGNHKCVSLCHTGPCYPCREKVDIVCNCGSSKIVVPCGRKKSTLPPKCLSECKLPSDCHHPKRQKHKCHYEKCPPCRLICGKLLKCGHTCLAKCHSAVLVKNEKKEKVEGPWDLINAYKLELVSKPCPPCATLVPVTCLGGHEVREIACHSAKPTSCGKLCGRALFCGNHTCKMQCHELKDITDKKQSDNCESCSEPCQNPRKGDCTHPCLKGCHSGDCIPCKQPLKMKCHCQINLIYSLCNEWNSTNEEGKRKLLSCSNRCPKLISCGHRCILPCHPGDCSSTDSCKKKVVVRCSCKRIKKEVNCFLLQIKSVNIDCDQECLESQKALQELELEKAHKIDIEKKILQEKELQEFLKKTEGRKKKRKKQIDNFSNEKNFSPFIIGSLSFAMFIIGAIIYYYVS